MADAVETAGSLPPADEADKTLDAEPVLLEAEAEARESEAEEPDGRNGAAPEPEDGDEKPEDARSLTELFEQLGRDLSELAVSETQLEAARNMPEVRRAARDVAGVLVIVIAALTAFAFVNVAALDGLSKALDSWLAALVLAAFWITVGGVLLLSMRRARQWLFWIVFSSPPAEAVEELEQERNADGRAALGTLEQIGPALAMQVAMAAVPKAGDLADGVVGVGGTVLEVSDEIVDVVTEQLPGGGVVNQVWDVALMPGRLGIKVATTVLRRGRPGELNDRGAHGQVDTSQPRRS